MTCFPAPPLGGDAIGQPVLVSPIVVGVKLAEWSENFIFWARFENLLGGALKSATLPIRRGPQSFAACRSALALILLTERLKSRR
jgi:hypothetical protein